MVKEMHLRISKLAGLLEEKKLEEEHNSKITIEEVVKTFASEKLIQNLLMIEIKINELLAVETTLNSEVVDALKLHGVVSKAHKMSQCTNEALTDTMKKNQEELETRLNDQMPLVLNK